MRIAGAEFGHRMTVVKLSSGDLWVHSPVECSSELVEELRQLGNLRYLVAPSRMHDLYLPAWFAACPELVGYAPRALIESKPEKGCTMALEDGPLPWSEEIGHVFLGGMPRVQEFDFFHSATQTLIVADLTFHLIGPQGLAGKLFLGLVGASGGIRTSRLFRMMVKDWLAFITSMEQLLYLDWQRVIVGHGENLEGPKLAEFRFHLESLAARLPR